MLKKLIEELLTDVVPDVAGENLEEEASENETAIFCNYTIRLIVLNLKMKMPNPQAADQPPMEMNVEMKQEITVKVTVAEGAAE